MALISTVAVASGHPGATYRAKSESAARCVGHRAKQTWGRHSDRWRLATEDAPEIEEERRLLYVAMTRAKDYLHLIVPHRLYARQQRSSGDRHMYALRTRFIPNAITDHFEQCTRPAPIRESSSPAVAL
jgi:superfamily I DNA/RNA helicase